MGTSRGTLGFWVNPIQDQKEWGTQEPKTTCRHDESDQNTRDPSHFELKQKWTETNPRTHCRLAALRKSNTLTHLATFPEIGLASCCVEETTAVESIVSSSKQGFY